MASSSTSQAAQPVRLAALTHLDPASSLLPNQSIITPAPPSHHLSAADDLITRFQLHHSYNTMLHPFRKDLFNREMKRKAEEAAAASAAAAGEITSKGKNEAVASEVKVDIKGKGKSVASLPPSSSKRQPLPITVPAIPSLSSFPTPTGSSLSLPKSYIHFLPPTLPGKVRPPRPPRRPRIAARKAAATTLEEEGSAAGKKELNMVKAQQEWERVSTSLRRAIMKPEYTPSNIRLLGKDDEAWKGFQVQAGEVEGIDRTLLDGEIGGEREERDRDRDRGDKGEASPSRRKKRRSGQ